MFRQATAKPDVDQDPTGLRREPCGRDRVVDMICILRSCIDEPGHAIGAAQRRPILDQRRWIPGNPGMTDLPRASIVFPAVPAIPARF